MTYRNFERETTFCFNVKKYLSHLLGSVGRISMTNVSLLYASSRYNQDSNSVKDSSQNSKMFKTISLKTKFRVKFFFLVNAYHFYEIWKILSLRIKLSNKAIENHKKTLVLTFTTKVASRPTLTENWNEEENILISQE